MEEPSQEISYTLVVGLVDLEDSFERWCDLRNKLEVESDAMFANILLNTW